MSVVLFAEPVRLSRRQLRELADICEDPAFTAEVGALAARYRMQRKAERATARPTAQVRKLRSVSEALVQLFDLAKSVRGLDVLTLSGEHVIAVSQERDAADRALHAAAGACAPLAARLQDIARTARAPTGRPPDATLADAGRAVRELFRKYGLRVSVRDRAGDPSPAERVLQLMLGLDREARVGRHLKAGASPVSCTKNAARKRKISVKTS